MRSTAGESLHETYSYMGESNNVVTEQLATLARDPSPSKLESLDRAPRQHISRSIFSQTRHFGRTFIWRERKVSRKVDGFNKAWAIRLS